MGGTDGNRNFRLNCEAWGGLYEKYARSGRAREIDAVPVSASCLGIAPVTGAVENIGFAAEDDFYLPYFTAAARNGIAVCAGDGCPDEKLRLGIEAARALNVRAYFFFKPYPDAALRERIAAAGDTALAVGLDIDAYNIATMRSRVHLERKTADQLLRLRRGLSVPFMLKGIFTPDDIALCRAVLPDIIVVSNHGGRVDTLTGSTADFLERRAAELRGCCSELWVDGGIRTRRDVQTALYAGAKKVLAARPFISALCQGGVPQMTGKIRELLGAADCPPVSA